MTRTRRRPLAPMLLLALGLPASLPPAEAATGGPDAFGYTWADHRSGCRRQVDGFGIGAVTYVGITGMQGPFDIGFPMPFFGETVTQVWISPHGYLTFSPQPNTPAAQTMPDGAGPNHLIATNWYASTDADVTVESSGGTFHVRWEQHQGIITITSDLYLERDGAFRIAWAGNWLVDRAIGYENRTGTQGTTLYRYEGGTITRDGSFTDPLSNTSGCIEPPRVLDCSNAITVACGETASGSLPATLSPQAAFYSCANGVYEGHEQVARLTVTEPRTVSVQAGGPGDLDLFAFGSVCEEDDCLAQADTATDTFSYSILFPGTYTYVLDKASPGGGDAWSLNVTCIDPFQALACDAPQPGDTSGGLGFRSNYSCVGPALDGPEALYRFNLPAPGTLSVAVDGPTADLWVILFDAATFDSSQGATCLAAGRGGAGLLDAPAGDYIVVVDGQAGAAGPFEIAARCDEALDCGAAADVSCTDRIVGDTSSSPRGASLYSCVTELLTGGEDIYRFFNPIEQTITAQFVSSQPGHRMLLLPACDATECFLAGDQGVSCALFPPGEYYLVIDGEPGADGPYEAEILCSEFVVGVDLQVTGIDASSLGADCQTFDVDGQTRLVLSNLGTSVVAPPFDVIVFEDGAASLDGLYDPAQDNLLGTLTVTDPLAAGETVFVDVPTSGTLLFRDNVIHAMVDPDDAIAEVDEDNNFFDTGRACEFRPPVGAFSPAVEWAWNSSAVEPTFTEVDTVPLVGDVNADGLPDVVINTAPQAGGNRVPAIVRALHGDGSGELWSATQTEARVWGRSQLALGDLDGDGLLETVGQSALPIVGGGYDGNHLVAIDDDGSFLWQSEAMVGMSFAPLDFGGGGASIADIDCDGSPEIVFGHNVFNADGTHFWTPQAGGRIGRNVGTFGPDCPLSVVVDVDGDGIQEVVAGPTCYRWNAATGTGDILWDNVAVPDGHAAVGNFDGDDLPEIAITANGTVYLLEGDTGALIWQRALPGSGNISGGPPTVADFDGDCAAEVGVAGSSQYLVLETNGTVRWQAAINDTSSHRTASSVFDFDGDGSAEVAFQDQHRLHVFSGFDGATIAEVPASSHTWIEMITIADVDADNNAEIIQPLNRGGSSPTPMSGVQVVGDADDNWVNTRRIWNQHAYHIGHVNDDGTIPGPESGCERPSWREHNTYRDQIGTAIFASADITISVILTELIANPDCFADLRIVARVGNGGATSVGTDFQAAFYDGDPSTGGSLLRPADLPDLPPGGFGDFEILIPQPRTGTIELWAVADDDGSGTFTGRVNECREDNNSCVVTVRNEDGGGGGTAPQPIGPWLRATGHGNPLAARIEATFDWSADAGLPRPSGDHYHVYRGTTPTALAPISADPWDQVDWLDDTPRSGSVPHAHFYRVVAADLCEQEEP